MSNKPPQRRLGRGISSLISTTEPEEVRDAVYVELPTPAANPLGPVTATLGTSPETTDAGATEGGIEISIELIAPNPHQPRKTMNDASIAELAESIRASGLIQPVIVRRIPSDAGESRYELIAGERRLRAAKLAGLTHINAICRNVDEAAQAQMALVENIQREDLNPIERAQAYRTLLTDLALTQSELSARVGQDRSSISNYLRLLDLTVTVQAYVRDGQLSVGHAKIIAGTSDPADQERLAKLVIDQSLSVRNLERVMQDRPATTSRSEETTSAHIKDLEKTITRQLGMRAQIRTGATKGRGKLIVHYATLDQFDDLLGRLGVQTE